MQANHLSDIIFYSYEKNGLYLKENISAGARAITAAITAISGFSTLQDTSGNSHSKL